MARGNPTNRPRPGQPDRLAQVEARLTAAQERLERQQAVLEVALLAVIRDVEAIAEALDEQYDYDDPGPTDGESYVRVDPDNPANEVDLSEGTEETPAEEADRLIREAQQAEDERRAAAERMNEGA